MRSPSASSCQLRHLRNLFLLTIILGSGLAACDQPSPQEKAQRIEAQEIWLRHEAAVVRALEGHQENDEFVKAVDFFADLTGIEIHVNIFTMGYLPEPEARNDLELIRAWYTKNKASLYYDADSDRVEVRPR